jgi:saposin
MLRFVVPLVALLTYGLAANVDECTFGESYWCSSLENAKTCGAFEHCKSTVWKNEILKSDDSVQCDFCKTIVLDVEIYIKENKTEQEILVFLINACQMIPVKSLSSECQSTVQTYLLLIIDLITHNVEPQVVCSLIKLCDGLEDKVSHPKLPVAEVKPQPITKFSPLPIHSEPICSDCKKFFTDIKNMVLSNATEAQIEAMIDQTLCAYLGTYEQMCKDLVKEYMPEIMQLLSSEFDPNVVCQSFGFCAQTIPETKTFLMKLRLKKSEFYQIASADNSAEGCNICKVVMKDIQDLDRNTAIQTEIKDFLKTQVCGHLGNFKSSCVSFVDAYGEVVFELLANELDPESRCRSLGFCSADNVIRDPVREATPSREPVSTPAVTAGPQCILCEFVMKELETLLGENATEAEIIAALKKVCSYLPATVRDSCDSFVDQYAKAIIEMLVQELDPSVICTTLGLCTSSKRVVLTKVEGGLECTVCETVVQYLEALVAENATMSALESALEKVCNFLPDKYKSECDYIVETYGSLVITYVTTVLTPKEICETVGACSKTVKMAMITEAKEVKTSQKLLGESECTWGPKFWCTSKENAAKCQATDFCEQTGWDF